jgi:RNA polymerase sigma-70 factor (ECF subfamily)
MELAEHYTATLHRLAYALTRNADDAHDVTRETLIYGWKNIKHLPVGRPFCPWLMRATRNVSISMRRRRAGGSDAAPGSPGVRTTARERVFLGAFGDLTPDEQVVLVMRLVERFAYQDIATALEVPTRTAMSRVATAREHLRARIAERARKAA